MSTIATQPIATAKFNTATMRPTPSIPTLPSTAVTPSTATTTVTPSTTTNITDSSTTYDPNFKTDLVKQVIQPAIQSEIKEAFAARGCWSTVSSIFYTLSIILFSGSTILLFVMGQIIIPYSNYIAGGVNILGMVCKGYAAYAESKDDANTAKLNSLISSAGIRIHIPDTSQFDCSSETVGSPSTNISREPAQQITLKL